MEVFQLGFLLCILLNTLSAVLVTNAREVSIVCGFAQ